MCADGSPPADFLGLRHVSKTIDGFPIYAWAWKCCYTFCTDAEILAGDCYKQTALWPHGPNPGGGIAKYVRVFLFDVNSCYSAIGKYATLTYGSADQKWHGSVVLRGCTLALTFSIAAGPTFTLHYDDGLGTTGDLVGVIECTDQLVINFGDVVLAKCCSCPGSGIGTTDTPAQVQFYLTANCRTPQLVRHVASAFGDVPVLALPRVCPWDQVDPDTCAIMTCPVMLSVTNVSGCACFAGDWTADYSGGAWENLAVGSCPGGLATFRMSCIDMGADSHGKKLVKLKIDVSCAATNIGSGESGVFLATDLETLDETITVTMTDPDPSEACCVGSISVRVTRV